MSALTSTPHHPSPLSKNIITTTTTATTKAPVAKSTFAPAAAFRGLPQKKKSMSITQTYYLAHQARAKLSTEAARADHDLRLLVGHANLLDSLMLDLAEAEREQESWFNQSVRAAHPETKKEERHIQWADTIVEADEYESDSDSDVSDNDSETDSEDEFDGTDDDIEMFTAEGLSLRRLPSQQQQSHKPLLALADDEDDMEEDDLEDDYAQLELVRTPSHPNTPPELELDSESSEDEDESMPPSPPNTVLAFSEKEAKQEIHQQQDHYYSTSRHPARLVSAISVY